VSEESATPDLVELARTQLEALNSRDFDAVMSFYAPDAVYVGMQLGTFEGAPTIRGVFEDLVRPFSDLHGELEEIIDLGNGVVFSVISFTGHPVGSSGELQNRVASVAIWTEGVIEQFVQSTERIDEARAAAERLAEERG
jgi:ketosteroid isomerase-like protein